MNNPPSLPRARSTAGAPPAGIRVRSLTLRGGQLRVAGDYAEAERFYTNALAAAEKAFGPDSFEVAAVLNQLGMLCKCTGCFDKAEACYQRALRIMKGSNNVLAADLYHNLGGVEHARGRFAEGEPHARRAVEIRMQLLGPDHADTAADVAALAALLDGQGKNEEAEALFRHALAAFEAIYGPEHYEVAVNLNNLAALYHATGRTKDVEALYLRALFVKEKLLGPEHSDVGVTLNNLAVFYKAQGRFEEAAHVYRRALAIFEQTFSPPHPKLMTCRENYEHLIRVKTKANEIREPVKEFPDCHTRARY